MIKLLLQGTSAQVSHMAYGFLTVYEGFFSLFADCAVRWRGPASLPGSAVGGFTVDPSPQVCPRLRAGWSADEAHTKGINSVLPAGLQEHRRLL